MNGPDRAMLYTLAIQTALRSSEIRSLTAGSLFLDSQCPYVVCKAGATKNRRPARQYIKPSLAAALREHLRTKAPQAPLFHMPPATDVAEMLRADLAATRSAWLTEAKHDPDEYRRRDQSDFLAAVNHEGERLDFHSLRHTTGAWAAQGGAHPKAIQTLMRHSSITLTMDTYGHLFPGQEAETVHRLPDMDTDDDALAATGTDDATANPALNPQHIPQQSGCD